MEEEAKVRTIHKEMFSIEYLINVKKYAENCGFVHAY